MRNNSGGGAAVSSGANFQARIAGYIIASDLCGHTPEAILDDVIETISFETNEFVDDINLATHSGNIYIQAKANISYSFGKNSEFLSVIEQFFLQFDLSLDQVFILATGSRASGKITKDLRHALSVFSKSPEEEFFRDQPQSSKKIINELRSIINDLTKKHGKNYSKVEFDLLLQRCKIAVLDIEEDDPLENSIKILLCSRKFSHPSLLWQAIISDCLSYAKQRSTIRLCDVEKRYEKYIISDCCRDSEQSDVFLKAEINLDDVSTSREFLLCDIPQENKFFNSGKTILVINRFGKNGVERVKFFSDKAEFDFGVTVPLIHRSATMKGMERIIRNNPDIGDGPLSVQLLYPEELNEDGLDALTHKQRIQNAAQMNVNFLLCLHCQKAVSGKDIPLIETGPLLNPAVGVCHNSCLTPTDRVLGIVNGIFFEKFPELINFDINSWLKASIAGQQGLHNFKALSLSGFSPTVAWSGKKPRSPRGDYVIEMILSDGSIEIATMRNQIERFSKAEAQKMIKIHNQNITEACRNKDPLCYTDQSKAFSNYTTLIKEFGGEEKIIPVVEARYRLYDERIDSRDTQGQWYAPLAYLKDLKNGEPYVINNLFFLITNPLRLNLFLENWSSVGIIIEKYEVACILTDVDFDELLRWVDAQQWQVLVDPFYNPVDRSLEKGYPIEPIESILSRISSDS